MGCVPPWQGRAPLFELLLRLLWKFAGVLGVILLALLHAGILVFYAFLGAFRGAINTAASAVSHRGGDGRDEKCRRKNQCHDSLHAVLLCLNRFEPVLVCDEHTIPRWVFVEEFVGVIPFAVMPPQAERLDACLSRARYSVRYGTAKFVSQSCHARGAGVGSSLSGFEHRENAPGFAGHGRDLNLVEIHVFVSRKGWFGGNVVRL